MPDTIYPVDSTGFQSAFITSIGRHWAYKANKVEEPQALRILLTSNLRLRAAHLNLAAREIVQYTMCNAL